MKNFTPIKNLTFLLVLFFMHFGSNAQTASQTFTSSGSFLVPAGVTQITVEVWGGGGRGGSRTSGSGAYGGGGGGAYARKVVTVVPNTSYSYTVGAGSSSTAAGGDSYFINTSTVLAKGGNSVPDNSSTGATGGAAGSCIGDVVYAGGNGANGAGSVAGGGGAAAGNNIAGAGALLSVGGIGASGGGSGGNGRTASSGNGTSATGNGGGGGGAYRTSGSPTGGSGANGQIIITYPIPEIDVLGNATSIADGDNTPTTADWTDFGTAAVSIGVTRTFTIRNTGTNASLTVGTITIGGTNPGDFSVTTAPASTVAANGSTTFIVTFTPSAAGLRSATISIVNNDSNENPYNFTIQGTGVNPEIDIQGNATSIVDGDTTPSTTDWTDYGTVSLGQNSTRTYTIYNTSSTVTMALGAISFSGTNAAEFTVISSPSATVAPLGNTTVTVQFTPTGGGVRSAVISIVNNDANENPYNFNIQGTGVPGEIDIQGNAVSIADGDTTPTTADWTDFGNSTVGSGVTRTYTIYNTSSTATLSIGAISFSGTNAGDFTVTSSPSATIAPLGSTTVTVQFTPGGSGTRSAAISIVNNDTNENPYNFNIQGTGLAVEINIQGNSNSITDGDTTPTFTDNTDFAGSGIGSGVTRTFTIQNSGTGTLTIGTISFSGTNAGDFSVTTSPSATVAAGGSTTFVVTFTPGALGSRTATISIVNNDSNENPYNFSLQGTGYSALTYGPGGVMANLQLWFRSDYLNGTTSVADGTSVNTWNTQGRGVDATRPGSVGAPIYRNNASYNINFNSVVDFTNDPVTTPQNYTDLDPARQYLEGASGYYTHDLFAVLLTDINTTSTTASMDIFCGDKVPGTDQTDGTGIGYGKYTQRFTGEVLSYCLGTTTLSGGVQTGYGVAQVSSTATYNVPGIINASNNAAINGMNLTFNANDVVTTTNDIPDFSNVSNSQFWIGRSEGWDGSLDARVGELICMSYRATDAERSNILSYLAVKYGITLGVNGTSMNYTNSDGSVIWDATANSGFNYDIAGIGRDDISRLNQKQSKSVNSTEVMTIGLTDIYTTNTANTNTFATDKSYLVWGANGGTMVDSGVDLDIDLGPTTITTITEVVNRKYKLVETGGDVGTVRVSVPTSAFTSGLPALGATDAYVMVVATNSAFTTGVETVFMSTTGGNQTCLYDFDGTKYISFGVAHQAVNPLHITLDGADDYVKVDNVNNLPNSFSIMVWVRPDGTNTLGTERTIISKKPDTSTGYQLVLQDNDKVRMEYYVAPSMRSLVSVVSLPTGIWHNIAVTYDSTSRAIKMYIDGVLDNSSAILNSPVNNTGMFSIGAQYIDKNNINNLWKGDIDELRMWNRAVTVDEIRYIMNQEILQNSTGTKGTILPTTVTKNDISSLTWSSLFAYYSMNSYIGTHLDDDSANTNRGSLVIPDKVSINQQTAPMPYQSTTNGLWSSTSSWVNGSIQDLPYSVSISDGTTPIDWNIVKTSHNIDSSGNKTLLGLFVNSNTLTASNDSKIEVSHYLKLDGKIDLSGKSQLLQTLNSDLDPTSSGSLERDQEGQKSRFNYNYWCSPVGTINSTSNNNSYTVNGVMKDGTTSTPQNITWTTGTNGSATSPITLSSYWIYKFQNSSGTYANWSYVGQNGTLNAGQGYTLKGTDASTSTQNYTFVGKPNNGLITSTVGANNTNLSGNPYPSALDSYAFIDANISTITGTLYFWEHFSSNNSHNLLAYQGGYAQRTKVGGTAAITFPGLSGLGSSTKAPLRYIPVGQGFFVVGSTTGGTITFNNDQRAFFKENSAFSTTLFRNAAAHSIVSVDHFNDNSQDMVGQPETFKKLRLGFDDHNGYHRQVLMGFMDQNATAGIDPGYDAIHLDNQPNDMYFMNGTTKLNISGEGYFNMNNVYPVSVKTDAAGTVTFKIDDTENFDPSVGMYIRDNVTNISHDVRNNVFTIDLPQGIIDGRFTLRFKEENALNTTEFGLSDGILVAYTSANSTLNIKNLLTDATVEKVTLYNLLGQSITAWSITNEDQRNIQLPVKSLSTGTYIVKVKTDKGDMSRKIIIN